jgi:hypothetical protein
MDKHEIERRIADHGIETVKIGTPGVTADGDGSSPLPLSGYCAISDHEVDSERCGNSNVTNQKTFRMFSSEYVALKLGRSASVTVYESVVLRFATPNVNSQMCVSLPSVSSLSSSSPRPPFSSPVPI